MKLIKTTFFVLFILLSISSVFAASGDDSPAAHLIYFDDPYEVELYDASGTMYDYVDWDMELPAGTTIKTFNSVAELELVPNGSIIKLAANTHFVIESFQTDETNANSFSMLGGKLRTVAARSGFGENYSIRTMSAVCGVRGTDFGLQVEPGKSDAVAVLQGEVEFLNIQSGESISVLAGQAADIFSDVFAAIDLDPATLASLFEPMSFLGADPTTVPGYTTETAAETTESALEEEAASIAEETLERFAESEPAETPAEVPLPSDLEPAEQPGDLEALVDQDLLQPVYDIIGRFLGLELGTITIDGITYKKVTFLPQLELGKFRMSLYLPIIYNTNMFDPSDYYRPEGNDEWSFGRDQSETLDIVSDVFRDIALKIKYIEYGDNRDTFFFKIGNVESVTLGHGILMRNFPFDIGFPVERHLGVNTGFNFKAIGFEALVADAGVPEIMGARLNFRPFHKSFPIGLAASSVVDLNPAGQMIPNEEGLIENTYGNPILISTALDLDMPIIETDPVAFIMFADAGALFPYYRESYGGVIDAGPAMNAILTKPGELNFDNLNNFAFTGGLFGNIFFIDYRLDFRMSKGVFQPSFFSSNYHRQRGLYVESLAAFFTDPYTEEFQDVTMGIYGEIGAKVGKLFTIEGGYFWPWEYGPNGIGPAGEDLFHLEFILNKGVIPIVGIYGSLSYDRTHFAETFTDSTLTLFDAYTTVKGELVFPIVPVIDIALIYTTSTAYDENGIIIPSDINPDLPRVTPSISVETRVNF